MDKKTPLYDAHVAAGGKMVPFAGYSMPVEYPAGLVKEHMAVRTNCGIFDVSHMGEVLFTGPGALATLNHLLTNKFDSMVAGRCRYAGMCYEDGGMVDDLIVYCKGEEEYLVVVNAANKDKDVAWMKDHLLADTEMEDISDSIAQIAVQGPRAEEILAPMVESGELPSGYYRFCDHVMVRGVDCLISRTGYTGEDGFEIYCPAEGARQIWDALLSEGAEAGLLPCGLGARDTLRLEAAMPLYGHEMDETVNPLETGLGFAVKMDKDEFIGKDAIAAQGEPKRKRIGIKVVGRGIVREHAPVFLGDDQIGITTSGTYLPYLKGAYAMALVRSDSVEIGDTIEVEVRSRRIPAEVVALPFYKRSK
ncbi:MAG: glycine cleavage system aminomethyltransferase GcvT [Eggerthellaceae bacterium]|jgi:aminomethyltransferase